MIREICFEDNQEIKKIIQDSLESVGLNIPGTAYFDPQLDDLYSYYKQLDSANYWILEINGEVLGGVGIAPFNQKQKIAELQKLYLKPAAQGLGHAKDLMKTALSFAGQHYQGCYLETKTELEAACRLYERFGFKRLNAPLAGSPHSAMNAWYFKSLATEK